jgi:hypothetical protein
MVSIDSPAPPQSPLPIDHGSDPAAGGRSLPLLPLPTIPIGSDIGASLAILAVQNGQLERSIANDDRNAQEQAAENDANQEVQALHSEASSMGSQAWMDGALSLAAGSAGGKSAVLGGLLTGAKGLGDGLFGAAEKDDEATAKGFEASVTVAQSGASAAHDAVSDADQLVQSALGFYKEYVATEGQTANAAAGRT